MSTGGSHDDKLLKRALVELRQLRARLAAAEAPAREPIAIVGMGCRFPGGAEDPEAFWRLLEEGADTLRRPPVERWGGEAGADGAGDPAGTPLPPGGFLDGVDRFDADFFGISPREARRMDPQQRLALEVSWEALESAGQSREGLRGSRSGVFFGVSYNDYRALQFADPARIESYDVLGAAHAVVSNRLSYFLDLRGPSLAVDTLCSSSLVAIHLACQSLRSRECGLAVAGGVFVMAGPELAVALGETGALSPDGRCKPFDAGADGFGRGEGCGVVVLKRLSDAVAAGDPVRAVIRGSAVNQCGHTQGISAPSGLVQEAVIREALERAGVEPSAIDFIETHGTGTALGDPIEVGALAKVFGPAAERRERPCRLGALKANLGHLEPAAGVAGLIRTVLSMERGKITPNPRLRELNPQLTAGELPFVVPVEAEPWPANGEPRRAGVSSFGMGGSNSHLVVEEAPRRTEPEEAAKEVEEAADRPWLLPISAHTPEALETLAAAYRERIAAELEAAEGEAAARRLLADVAYSSGARRSHHRHRLAVVGRSAGELLERLAASASPGLAPASESEVTGVARGEVFPRTPGLVFVFSGQGCQWPRMGVELAAGEPAFRRSLERCHELLGRHGDFSLLDELHADPEAGRLDRTEVAQPAIFAVQVALAELLRSWGVVPDAVVGHSVGEVAAAHVAGVLTLEEAVRVVYHRGRSMASTAGGGGMAAVGLGLEATEELLEPFRGRLSVAAANGLTSTVVSGEHEALQELEEKLEREEVFCRRVKVDYAFHGPWMAGCGEEVARSLGEVETSPAQLPLLSTVRGDWADDGDFDAAYWARNVRRPVLFAPAVDVLFDDGFTTFLELGGHPVLTPAISEHRRRLEEEGMAVGTLRRDDDEAATLLGSLGALYTRGYPLDWRALHPGGRFFPRLPRYPWQRQRFWIDPVPGRGRGSVAGPRPLVGARRRAELRELELDAALGGDAGAHLRDHRLGGVATLPATAYLELALSAADEAFGPGAHELRDVAFEQALFLPEEGEPPVRIRLDSDQPGRATVQVVSGEPAGRAPSTRHAAGTVVRADGGGEAPSPVPLAEVRERCTEAVTAEEHYRAAARRGLDYGPAFQGVEEAWRGDGEAVGRIALPEAADPPSAGGYRVHPAFLDACLQLLLPVLPGTGDTDAESWIPVGVRRVWVGERSATEGWAWARLHPAGGEAESRVGDLTVTDGDGRVLVELQGTEWRRLDHRQAREVQLRKWLHRLSWEPQPLEAAPAEPFAGRDGRWLLFTDGGELGDELARRLADAGQSVVPVAPGMEAEELDRLDRLDDELDDADAPPWRGVIHLGRRGAEPVEELSAAELQQLSTERWLPAVRFLQRWLRSPAAAEGQPLEVWWVTRGAHRVVDGDGSSVGVSVGVSLAEAPIHGLARTLAGEHPELRVRTVDLAVPGASEDDAGDETTAAETVWRELAAAGDEPQVAVRPDGRYVARLTAAPPGDLAGDDLRLRRDASYLVTGGLGGLGLAVAEWMMARGAGRILLAGRGEPSEAARETLDRLASDAASGSGDGVEIDVVRLDVTDEAAVTEFFARTAEAGPPLAGIVHAAGVLDDGLFPELTPERFDAVLAPKVRGAWNLHRATLEFGNPLDFFVLFSSVTAVLGAPGQANYAAANAFLDALAHHRRAAGRPATAVGWGPWGEVGMAARLGLGERLGRVGLGTVEPAAGLELLGRLLAGDAAHRLAVPFDAEAWARSRRDAGARRLVERLTAGGGAAGGDLRAALRETDGEARRQLLESWLRRQLGRLLGVDAEAMDGHRSLGELGIDSLVAVELSGRLQDAVGVRLPLVKLFQLGVAELAAELLPQLGEAPADDLLDPATAIGNAGAHDGVHPLSYPQEGLWIEYQLDRHSWAYNVVFALRVESEVDVPVLRRCYQRLADRHAVLRTSYREVDGTPVQDVAARWEVPFSTVDASGWSRAELDRRVEAEARRPFELEGEPAVRVNLFSRAPEEHVLLFVSHHMTLDLWSFGILYRELGSLYAAATAGEEAELPAVAVDYPDYVRWQRSLLDGPEGERLEAYWRRQLEGELPALDLPFDRPRPEVRSLAGAAQPIELDEELVLRLRALADEHRTTLFVTLLAAFQLLLHRVTGQDDVVVSSPMAGRGRRELLDMVGHFINVVPLPARFGGERRGGGPSTFGELVARVGETVLGAVEHQDYPASFMVQRLLPARHSGQTSLFDVEFLLNSAAIDQGGMSLTLARPGSRWSLGGLQVETVDLAQQAGQFELGIELYETGEVLSGMVQYRPELFDATTVQRLSAQYRVLLEAVAESPGEALDALPVLTPAERHQVVVELPAWRERQGAPEGAAPGGSETDSETDTEGDTDDELDDLFSEVMGELDVSADVSSADVSTAGGNR